NTVYFGTTKIYQSVDAGNTWMPISNDIAVGSNGQWVNSIAVGPANSGVIYAGLNNGQVYVANNVSPGQIANFIAVNSGLPPRTVTALAVDPSHATGNTAYAAFSGFAFVNASINDSTGHIFKTTDAGHTWVDVSCSVSICAAPAQTDLPNTPVNDLVLDPDLPNIIYAA